VRILLFGKNGQIGSRLQGPLSTIAEVVAVGRSQLDLENFANLQSILESHQPDVIVNAAAYTNVERAEVDSTRAHNINCGAVKVMARYAAREGIVLVHYSSDYVFDGKKQEPYSEQDATSPLNVYGATKRDGEDAIRSEQCRHLILRTSWVYSSRGANFANAILDLARERDVLHVVADQIGSPTSARLVAQSTADILTHLRRSSWPKDADGTYHLAASGATSWYGFARLLVREAHRLGVKLRCSPERVIAINSTEYATRVKRPANSRLSTEKVLKAFGLSLPNWSNEVPPMVSDFAKGERN
jgi:dTDP-4-dehydrorhamnose reductase